MKSVVTTSKGSENVKFPALYMHKRNKTVVLFTSEQSGTVISLGTIKNNPIGFHDNYYTNSCLDDQYWERLPPGSKVELVQE